MGAILRLDPTLERHLREPWKNRKQQKDAPLQVHHLNCFFLSVKNSQVLSKKKRQQRYALNNMFYSLKSKAKQAFMDKYIA